LKYVLDTNILVADLNGDPAVIARLNEVEPFEEAILPALALAELRFGASSSRRVGENLARIERILERVAFAPVDRPIAERFGDLKADLRRRGITKSDADLLIAATALQLGAILVTNDQNLLDGSIRQMLVENWIGSAAP